jgi:hypothetical protein
MKGMPIRGYVYWAVIIVGVNYWTWTSWGDMNWLRRSVVLSLWFAVAWMALLVIDRRPTDRRRRAYLAGAMLFCLSGCIYGVWIATSDFGWIGGAIALALGVLVAFLPRRKTKNG